MTNEWILTFSQWGQSNCVLPWGLVGLPFLHQSIHTFPSSKHPIAFLWWGELAAGMGCEFCSSSDPAWGRSEAWRWRHQGCQCSLRIHWSLLHFLKHSGLSLKTWKNNVDKFRESRKSLDIWHNHHVGRAWAWTIMIHMIFGWTVVKCRGKSVTS